MTMTIGKIFNKDIHRSIKGVVKVQDLEETQVWQELDEYVVTPEVETYLGRFLSSYNQTIDSVSDEVGVWVSGFFGSGKSHFIKILSYLLAGGEVKDSNSGNMVLPGDVFKQKNLDGLLLADLHKASSPKTHTLLFNIDSKANQSDGEYAILNVFLREFNALQGFYEDRPFVAEIERELYRKGAYEAFEAEFQKLTGKEWKENRDQVLLLGKKIIQALATALPDSSSEDVAAWFDDLKKNYSPSIDQFCQMLKEYVDEIEPNSRIVFLVDEVGQFVGDNTEKMLKLQTLAEDIGTHCKGKVWVIVTSQEDIDKVIGDLKQSTAMDFSKIQGRFKTRISLSSKNADEVIKGRLLTKTDDASKKLKELYVAKEAVLKNLLSFSSQGKAMNFYNDVDDFVVTYPFVPYQFELLQNVFTKIRQIGATGKHLSSGERSMIDGFQSAAKSLDKSDVGALAPFYLFYDCVESNLESAIKQTIERAANDKSLQQPFDLNLLKLLFLIRHQEKEIPPTVENLSTLSITNVDEDKLQLKKDIEKALDRLESQSLIRRQDDQFFFLTNEEQEIQDEIKHIEFDSGKAGKLLGEMIFDGILDIGNKCKYERLTQVFSFTRICDSHQLDKSTELEFSVISPFHEIYQELKLKAVLHTARPDRGMIFQPLIENARFDREFKAYLKTEAFVNRPEGSITESRRRIIDDLREQNRTRRTTLIGLLHELLLESPIYIAGKEWKDGQTKTPKLLFLQAFQHLVNNTYSKLALIGKVCKDPDLEISSVMKESDVSKLFEVELPHKAASDDLKAYVARQSQLGAGTLLSDLVERYNKIPYGWPEKETILIVARLAKMGEISLLAQGETLDKMGAVPYLTKSTQWKFVKIRSREKVSTELLSHAYKISKDWFGTTPPATDEDGLTEYIQQNLIFKHESLVISHERVTSRGYPGKEALQAGIELVEKLQAEKEASKFLTRFVDNEKAIRKHIEEYEDVGGFLSSQVESWDLLTSVRDQFLNNKEYLEAVEQAKQLGQQVEEILSSAVPYSFLKDAKKISDQFGKVQSEVFQGFRSEAMTAINESMEQLNKVCVKIELNNELDINKILAPLKAELERIPNLLSIAKLENIKLTAGQVLLEQAKQARELAQKIVAGPDKEPKPEESQPQYISAANLVPLATGLNSEEQIDQFLNELKAKIFEALKKGPVFLR